MRTLLQSSVNLTKYRYIDIARFPIVAPVSRFRGLGDALMAQIVVGKAQIGFYVSWGLWPRLVRAGHGILFLTEI